MEKLREKTLATIVLFTTLGACQPNIVGGPCSYETTELRAQVSEINPNGYVFAASDEEIHVPEEYVRMPLQLGDNVILTQERITEGTCTPVIYSVVPELN